ncbi:MAG: dihydrolipoyl dehydrogenase [Pseudomonadota bacterium]
MNAYDIAVIGGGPGGYVAAIRASQLGLRAAVIEREHLGGICLNWGCIPTKALLRSAEILHYAQNADAYGLVFDGTMRADPTAVIKRSRGISGQLNGGVGYLLAKNNVDTIWGQAFIQSAPGPDGEPGDITVGPPDRPPFEPAHAPPKGVLGHGTYQAKNIIVATGARPRVLPGIESDGDQVWTYYEAMVPKQIPKSLLIIGSGAIGIEFASFYRTMGADVTVVEIARQILPAEDAEIAKLARKRFEAAGIKILTGAKVSDVSKTSDSITATIEQSTGRLETLRVEKVLSAVGVVGNTDGLGLEAIGVESDRGTISTDGLGRTNVPGIYAIGDVAGAPMLAHKAEHEGVACVEAIAGRNPHPIQRDRIPGCTYCHPQIASIGLTEAAALDAGHDVRVGRFPFRGNGKAIALGEPDGLVKTVFDGASGQLLGAHLIGAEVTELIQGFAIAMQLETTEEDLMRTVFPHPTLSEMMHESVLDAYGRVVHA